MHTLLKQPSLHGVERRVAGATLIEAMVALVIMSIGMLGLAGLQMTGLNDNADAERRTQGTIIVNDLIERMRANTTAVTAGTYAGINFATIDCTAAPATYCAARGVNPAVDCTSDQVASFDAYVALCEGAVRLPAGFISVQCTDADGAAQACDATSFRSVNLTYNDSTNTAKSIAAIVRP